LIDGTAIFVVPDAPISPVASAGSAQASVAFTTPESNGGSSITSYTVTSSPGGFTATASASPIVIAGLTNGTAYTFTVVATNAAGNSMASVASNSITPITVPGAPTSPVATAGNAQASVSFTAPASNGGSAIISYTVTSSPSGFTVSGASSPIVVTGLTNGTAYTFTVFATNTAGNSVNSLSSSAVTANVQPTFPVGTVNCGFVTTVIEITSPAGRIWMDRNLGASAVATSSTDANAFGDLYQWGRRADGHQCRNLANVTATLSSTDTPSHGNFIQVSSSPHDWRNPQSTTLWQGTGGTNNPCPTGFRLPTQTEWQAEINAIGTANQNITGFYNSTFKLTQAHRRNDNNTWNTDIGSYWSSTLNGTWGRGFSLNTVSYMYDDYRANGYSVRCIKHL
jgi:uncharacterized protein (TIGR02145 family)